MPPSHSGDSNAPASVWECPLSDGVVYDVCTG